MIVAALAADVHAFGLDAGRLRSSLGEPLELRISAQLERDEAFSVNCVQILNVNRADAIPSIVDPSLAVDRDGDRSVITVRTRRGVNDPAIRIVVQAGCVNAVTREYVFLLDPPVPPVRIAATAETTPPSPPETPVPALPARAVASDMASQAATVARSRPSKPNQAPTAGAATTRMPPTLASASAANPPAPRPRASARPDPTPTHGRVRLVEPGLEHGLKLSDAVTVAAADAPVDGTLKEAQARTRAALTDAAATQSAPSAREAQLTQHLSELGDEIQALKKQIADESARAAALRADRLPAWWLYLAAGIAAVALLAVAAMWVQYRRMKRTIRQAPWWLETRLRPKANAAVPAPAHDASTPAAPVRETAADPNAVDVSAASAENLASTRRRPVEAHEFPARVDHRIEVQELGVTQAMQVLQPDKTAVSGATSPDALRGALRTRPPDVRATGPERPLSNLDFDLGSLNAKTPPTPPAPAAPPVRDPLERTAPTPIVHDTALSSRPAWLAGAAAGMSWNDAKQAQTYLRAVAETIEQAEAFIAAGQTETAASVLRRLIQEREAVPRAPWLLLLQLYRRIERRDAYDLLAGKFLERFGRAAPPWASSPLPASEPGLDGDPSLLQAIWAHWGAPDSMALLAKLLYELDGPGDRFFNYPLQRDLLNFVKICPLEG